MSRRQGIDRALLALGGLVVVSSAVRFALSSGVEAPWIAPDEQLYGLLGRSLVAGDGLRRAGRAIPYYSLVYPLLVGLPFAWTGLEEGVRTVQLLQAVAMSLTAVPVYLWARPVAGSRWALAAAGLTVLIPGLVYSGLFMSEALYYLVATLAVWALAACLERPTLVRQSCLLGCCGARVRDAAAGGRPRRDDPSRARSRRRRRAFPRSVPAAPADAWRARSGRSLWVAARVRAGGLGELLGAYAPLGEADEYSLGDIAQSLAWQTGAVALITVAVPLVALGILAWEMLRGREAGSPRPRARRLGACVRRRHARRRRRVRIPLRGARDRAPASLRRSAHLRGLRGLAPPWCTQTAAGDLDRRVRGCGGRAPPPARPRDHACRVRRLAVHGLARAAQPAPRSGRVRGSVCRCPRRPTARGRAAPAPHRARALDRRRARAGRRVARRLRRDAGSVADRARAHVCGRAGRLDRRSRRA